MKRLLRRGTALLCVLALTAILCPQQGKAAPDVYFTAANENVMDLLAETMPFWSDGELYVSNALFLGRELGVSYVRNNTMGLALTLWATPYTTGRGTPTPATRWKRGTMCSFPWTWCAGISA